MHSVRRPLIRVGLIVATAAAVLGGVSALYAVTALPKPAGSARAGAPNAVNAGPATLSVESSASAIPVGGDFSYTATVSSRTPLQYLQVRMRLMSPEGRLIYQKTFVKHSAPKGTSTFVFARSIRDIDLEPGAYPLEVSLRVAASGATTQSVLPRTLVVFDPSEQKVPLVLAARISAQPLTDSDGKFVSDPGDFTRARDDALAVSQFVLSEPRARLTLALSPLMLEEWKRISSGYQLAGAEGDVDVPAGDPVPVAYADALETLLSAERTGRLEVVALGYSDPSITELDAAGIGSDVGAQYQRGRAAVMASVETSVSTGTAPAGRISDASAKALTSAGVSFAVVRNSSLMAGKAVPPPGLYRTRGTQLRVLASSDAVATTMTAGNIDGGLAEAFRASAVSDTKPSLRCVPLLIEIGPSSMDGAEFVQLERTLLAQPWLRPALAREIAGRGGLPTVRFRGGKADKQAPPDYWRTVSAARRRAIALQAALPERSPIGQRAIVNSLIAESSKWSGVDGRWAPAGRGLAFAAESLRLAESVFGKLVVSAKPVTLAGARGKVPVTVVNGTDETLRVNLVSRPGASMRIDGPATTPLTLPPGETYTEVPIELNNVLTGNLALSVQSAGIEVASATVGLRASYLDRLAIVGALLLVLGALLVFIITRVRAAEHRPHSSTSGRSR